MIITTGITLLGSMAAGAGIGAWVGHSRILCADGSCAITGTWFGAGIFGALIGLFLAVNIAGIINRKAPGDAAEQPQDDQEE